MKKKVMTARNLLKIRSELNELGIDIWIDGGWGIDALLGKETRNHKDIDFIADKKFYKQIREYFTKKGYVVSTEEPDERWHFIMDGPEGELDVMLVGFLEEGGATYEPVGVDVEAFPAFAFEGRGSIKGVDVRCVSAKYRMLCLTKAFGVVERTGYVFSEKDYNDLKAISEKFSIPMPEEFEKAKENSFPDNWLEL